MAVDFDVLVENARSAQSKIGEQTLWKAAFALEQWYFLGVGEGDDLQPLCAVAEGHVHLLAFTDEDRAQAMADQRPDNKPASVVHMDVQDAVDYCQALDQGEEVAGVFFNNGDYGFGLSLASIVERYRRHAKDP
ncbi:MAG: hypothetical protein KF757_06490 [Phycisphaeraceae bacterium]|nr:hypothetical protein [Phycisphaeraceae bacterium]MCW5763251.1 hypothetical protein [Phycisphaeraceae bacterium]